MDAWVWIVIVAAVVVVLAVALWLATRRRRTAGLQEQFGPEYDRAVTTSGDRRAAETELLERRERRKELDIRPLSQAARDRYSERWQQVQSRFVDEPVEAVGEADRLVSEAMRERGYPMDDFEQRAADISVDHPDVVENYRAAHSTHEAYGRGDAGTEDLRQAMVHYRSLFDELLDTGEATHADAVREGR